MLLLAAAGAATAQGRIDLPPEVLLLARIRQQAQLDLAQLPSFTCLETIDRFSRDGKTADWRRQDALRVEVAYVGDKELFAWPGSTNFEERPLAQIVGTGMASSGEFTSFARMALLGAAAVTHFAGEEQLHGRRMARWDYDIAAAFSGLTLASGGEDVTVGQHGSFWADVETFELVRLAVSAVDIPGGLGIESVGTEIEYQRVHLGPAEYLLPQRAITRMQHSASGELRNDIEFTHCRQFSAESVVSFVDVEPQTPGAGTQKKVEVRIPAGLVIPVRLDTPIDSARAKVGDAVAAVVDANVMHKGALLAPRGALLSGRLRLLQKEPGRYVVGLEFTDLTFGNKHVRFLANLSSVDARYARLVIESVDRKEWRTSEMAGVTYTTVRTETPAALPGVGSFFVAGSGFQLPRGMRMEWTTVELGPAR